MMLKDKQIDALIICSRICEWDHIEEYISYGPIILSEDTRGKKYLQLILTITNVSPELWNIYITRVTKKLGTV
jgi:predicted GNAT family N-acyltransferase